MHTATIALRRLGDAVDTPRPPGVPLSSWRWSVRQRIAAVHDVLTTETPRHRHEWLAARTGAMLRERNELLIRLSTLARRVLESDALDEVRAEMHRLLADVRHHLQRRSDLGRSDLGRSDLAYDEVELERGGSE
jgi:hypothetical protein